MNGKPAVKALTVNAVHGFNCTVWAHKVSNWGFNMIEKENDTKPIFMN